MRKIISHYVFVVILLFSIVKQSRSTNFFYSARDTMSLNGTWQILIDPFDIGQKKMFYKTTKPANAVEILEYGFSDKNTLKVPGDWNSQREELKYFEGSVWYHKTFDFKKEKGERVLIKFEAAANEATVYLNGKKIGEHEGGFSPFVFDITEQIKDVGENYLVVRVNNQRKFNAIPALEFDWWNYGGLTREVKLIRIPELYIVDYFLQLKKNSMNKVEGWVKLNKPVEQRVTIKIAGAKISKTFTTNSQGIAYISFDAALTLWSPKDPHLYQVEIVTTTDRVTEWIGFRNIETRGADILLNGKPIFLKGVNIHEEIPQQARRAWSQKDAELLIGWAKELGCNFVRLAHYPHNEAIVKLAEKNGLMIWEEIPLWGELDFEDSVFMKKANRMLSDMISRDKNRCGIIIWSLSNETSPSPKRNQVLFDMAARARLLDPTRLISSAFDKFKQNGNEIRFEDPVGKVLDIISVNRYQGWYQKWPGLPGDLIWRSIYNKPMIVSEFGGEAVYGTYGSADSVNWSEEHQEKIFKDNIKMFEKMSLLRGVCPWILVDFRSPRRLQPEFQDGWNRKGLLSEKGEKKKAWFVMKDYYSRH